MAYRWMGMKVLTWEAVKMLHENGELAGCYKLYMDETESEISENYDWSEIEQHYERGGGFGWELQTLL